MKNRIVFFVVIAALSCTCLGEIYPVTYEVEGKTVQPKCYVEIQEDPFLENTARDRFLLDYFKALESKDAERINRFLEPDIQINTEDSFALKQLEEYQSSEIVDVIKYAFNGYDVYQAGNRTGGTYTFCMRQNDKDARLGFFPDYQTTSIITHAVMPFVLKKGGPDEVDCSSMTSIVLGSNDIAKVYFQFLDQDNPVTLKLKRAEDDLVDAYQSKDLDRLAQLTGKLSLEKMQLSLSGTLVLGGEIGSCDPIGVIDMDPIYVYLGRKNRETVVLRKYMKQGDHYVRVNYGYGGIGIDDFLESDAFAEFVKDKVACAEKVSAQSVAN